MCTTANASLIDACLDERVQENALFTAWDITSEAKRRGATEYHNDMKGQVHSHFLSLQNSGYTRSLVPTPTGEAFLYHPTGADIQPYIDQINSKPAPSVPPAQPVAGSAPAAGASVVSTGTLTPGGSSVVSVPPIQSSKSQALDAEGRLPLYADTLSAIGATPGSTVIANGRPGDITIGLPNNTGKIPDRTYIVNADGRVRLSEGFIKQVFATPPVAFTIEVANGEIVIS